LNIAAIATVAFALTPLAAQTARLSDAQARSEATAAELRERALESNFAYEFLRRLTDFGPRLAGSRGERAAAAWVSQEWRSLGFRNVQSEPFPLLLWQRNEETAEVVSPHPQKLRATALGGSPATPPEGIVGEVAIFKTLDDLSNVPRGSLSGKIAMLDYHMPRTESGQGYNIATAGRSAGPGAAADAGAAAFVMRSAGTDAGRSPHAGLTRYRGSSAPIPAFALSAMDANQIERLAERGPVRLRLWSNASSQPAQSQNVIAEIPGVEHPEQIVVVGAHLDSWDLGTGAVDDAAGVAVITAAAKLISQMPRRPRRTIRLVSFGAEEVSQPADPFGLFGATAYAKTHSSDLHRYVVASESDLGADRIYGLDLPAGAASTAFGQQVQRVMLPLGIIVEAETPPNGGADFLPLQTAGVPIFLLKQDATRYFDLHHTELDTFDEVEKGQLDQNVAAWAALLWLIANGDVDFRETLPRPNQ
jgi:hypothetical protein